MKLTESVLRKMILKEMNDLDMDDMEDEVVDHGPYGNLAIDMENKLNQFKRDLEKEVTEQIQGKQVKSDGIKYTLKRAIFYYDNQVLFIGEYYDAKYKRTRTKDLLPQDLEDL